MIIRCGKCGGGFHSAEEFSAHGCAIEQQIKRATELRPLPVEQEKAA